MPVQRILPEGSTKSCLTADENIVSLGSEGTAFDHQVNLNILAKKSYHSRKVVPQNQKHNFFFGIFSFFFFCCKSGFIKSYTTLHTFICKVQRVAHCFLVITTDPSIGVTFNKTLSFPHNQVTLFFESNLQIFSCVSKENSIFCRKLQP